MANVETGSSGKSPPLTPTTERQEAAAARAIYLAQKKEERVQLVESLSHRERCLVENAWEAGVRAARTGLAKKLASPHAVTLDAESVAKTVREWNDVPDLYSYPGWGRDYDPRVVQLIVFALRHAESLEANEDT